jgi:hypothetical protein
MEQGGQRADAAALSDGYAGQPDGSHENDGNLIQNAGFNNGLSEWWVDSFVTNWHVDQGAFCADIAPSETKTEGRLEQNDIRITAGVTYSVSFFASGDPIPARYLVRQPLSAIAARLDSNRFVQAHRSEIVRVDAILRLEPWTHGDGILVMTNESTVVLTRTYRKEFLERFGR